MYHLSSSMDGWIDMTMCQAYRWLDKCDACMFVYNNHVIALDTCASDWSVNLSIFSKTNTQT